MATLKTDQLETEGKLSGFEPLSVPLFRDLWLASIVSNLGGWMQDTAGTWLMTVLTPSPLLIALMQTAASLPVVILGLLAGATADIFDRRRLLIFWQAWMLTAVAILSVLTFFDIISPWILLILTFLLNIGTAMNSPAWQAIVPEVIPRVQLPDAISLNSAGFNLARALGPALGGMAIALFAHATTGAASTFLLNSLSFVGVILVLYRWQRNPLFKSALPAERIRGSVRAGIRYLRYAPMLQAAFMRTLMFTLFVSAVWALLAVVARNDLHQGAMGYGILNGSMGFGAVIGATNLPRVRRVLSADAIIASSTGVFVATLAVLALVKVPLIIIPMLIAGGFAWTSAMSTLNLAVQVSVPAWVQARALGAYQMIFAGGMALGGVIWGYIAEHVSTSKSLMCAAAGLAVTLPLSLRFHVLRGVQPDFSPHSYAFPAPKLASEREDSDGRFGCRSITISTPGTMPPLPKPSINCGMCACGMALFAGACTRTRQTLDISMRRLSPNHGSSTCGSGSASRPRIWRPGIGFGASTGAMSRPGFRICSMPKRSLIRRRLSRRNKFSLSC